MKPRCAWYRRQMETYAAAAEPLPPASPLARHLEACDRCRAAWESLQRLTAELRQALVVPTAPEGLEARAWARMPAAQPRPTVRARTLTLGAALAATLVLLNLRQWMAGPAPRLVANLPPPHLCVPPIAARSTARAPEGRQKTGRHERRLAKALPAFAVAGASQPAKSGFVGTDRGFNPGKPGGGAVALDVRTRFNPGKPGGAAPQTHPKPRARPSPARPIPDLQYLDGSDPGLLARWSPLDRREEARLEAIRRHLPPPADDFVRIPFPLIASTSSVAIATAARDYEKQAKVIDTRLFRKVTLAEKGVSLADFCAHLQEQTGVKLSASRATADEKVTVFVNDERARDVMRAVARLFGFLWLRSGEEGRYRYELDQGLRSQLIEEELRNRDQDAALLALDAEMQKYRPFLDMSFVEVKKRAKQGGEAGKLASSVLQGGYWAGVQIYFHLTPRDRAALAAGRQLLFQADAPDPDLRFPAEWNRPILESMGSGPDPDGHPVPIADAPGVKFAQVKLRLDRSELGEVSLNVLVSAMAEDPHERPRWSTFGPALAVGRSPSAENPGNAAANAGLRKLLPFSHVISLHPQPSCLAAKGFRWTEVNWNMDAASGSLDRSQPYALSADVWEAVHQATGLPIVADFYTHLYPLGRVTVERQPLFEALCTVGDAMGARWRKDGDFLVCRSISYFWDKLKEVPNRYLQRWAQDRDANGGLPLADFLEMATMTDQQLDSDTVAQGIEHYWRLPEWAWLGRHLMPPPRANARMLALLTPEQLRRAQRPDGIPFRELTPTQHQRVLQLQLEAGEVEERETGSSAPATAPEGAEAWLRALYVPDGWYVAYQQVPFNPSYLYGGRTPAEAKAAQRQFWHTSEPLEVRRVPDGYFASDIYFVVGKEDHVNRSP